MKVVFYSLFGLFTALLMLATLFDGAISEMLYVGQTPYTVFIHRFGHMPNYWMLFLAVGVLFKHAILHRHAFKRLTLLMMVLFSLAAVTLFIGTVWRYFDRPGFTVPLVTLVMLVSAAGLAVLFPERNRRYREYALIYVVTFFIAYLIVATLKFVWMRERFMHGVDPMDVGYWFVPEGFFVGGGQFTSFPSGHMTSATMTMVFVVAARELKAGIVVRVVIAATFGAWLGLVALGRLMGGYHYLSDLVVAAIVVVVTMTLVRRWLEPIIRWLETMTRKLMDELKRDE